MEITWLGQAGLMFECSGKILLVDPYLSDSVARSCPQKHRRVGVDTRFLLMKPDYILLTHDHADHTDDETLSHYLSDESEVTVLASGKAWRHVRKYGGKNNYVLFNEGTTWTETEFVFTAVHAEHSDNFAVGAVIAAEGKNYYVTGDTLYSERVFESLSKKNIYAVFLPINGAGNNMNCADAKKFADRTHAKYAVPLHFGLLDDISPDSFYVKNKVVPHIYEKIRLG